MIHLNNNRTEGFLRITFNKARLEMAIGLKIPKKNDDVLLRIRLPKDLSDQLDLYVKAAKDQNRDADQSMVLQAILKSQFKKDREFTEWVKRQ
jgi:hypothetical protein